MQIEAGVSYNGSKDEFTFDFEHDGETDIIKLRNQIKEIDFFGSMMKFSYEFSKDIDSSLRSKFIKALKFKSSIPESDKKRFIRIAVSKLCNAVDMSKFKCVVVPESNSDLVSELLKYIILATTSKLYSFKLIKNIPADIRFDYDSFIEQKLNSTIDGKPRYTEKQKQEVLANISKMMDEVHKLNYFSIARNFKGKYRIYLNNFYKFSNPKDKEAFERIKDEEILVVDDIATSGTTMNMLLKTLGVLGRKNVVLFSLIGTDELKI